MSFAADTVGALKENVTVTDYLKWIIAVTLATSRLLLARNKILPTALIVVVISVAILVVGVKAVSIPALATSTVLEMVSVIKV